MSSEPRGKAEHDLDVDQVGIASDCGAQGGGEPGAADAPDAADEPGAADAPDAAGLDVETSPGGS